MKNLTYIVLILGLGMLFGCEDVIEVELPEAPTLMVVDAWLNNLNQPQTIRLSESQNYFKTERTSPITGARVTVTSGSGGSFAFQDQGDGDYIWTPGISEIMGEIGEVFNLRVEIDGNVYSSTTLLAPVPAVDEITQETRTDEFGPDGIYTQFFARDLPGLGNTYWIKTYKNDKFLNKPSEINLAYDAGFDAGAELDGIIFIPPIREFTNPFEEVESGETVPSPWAEGDIIRVEIHSISLEAFLFMEIARDQILNGDNSIFATPIANTSGNIISNSTNAEVLGIFNVAAVSSLEKTIE